MINLRFNKSEIFFLVLMQVTDNKYEVKLEKEELLDFKWLPIE